jgi:hypothetical protein
MKSKFLLFQKTFGCVAAFLILLSAQAQNIDCAAVGQRVAAAVKANPSDVLTIVEDAMVAYEQCACEVVTAAIEHSNASADTVKQIVLVAVRNAETQAPAIAECAVGAAPEHADAVRLAFSEAFNGKEAPVAAAASGAAATTTQRREIVTEPSYQVSSDETAAPVQEWSGKDVVVDTTASNAAVYGDPSYDEGIVDYGKAPIYIPEKNPVPAVATEYFGAAPLTLGNAFLIPPVSASAIIINDDDDEEVREVIKEHTVTRTRTRTNTVTRFVPRVVTKIVPVSPTSP